MVEATTEAGLSGRGAPNPSGPGTASPDASRQQQTQTSTSDRPAYVPEAFWDPEKKTVKLEDLAGKFGELSAAQQAEADRRAALPKQPGEYAFTPPEGFKLPEGSEIDTADPMWGKLQTLAHQNGWSADDFSKVAALGLNMRMEQAAAFHKSINDFKAAEEAKLGDNSKARVEGVHRFFDANFGDAAKAMKDSLANSEMVAGWEKTISMLQSAGVTAFNGSGRDDGRRLDGKPQNWDQMSPVDRLTWTRQNAPQPNGTGR